MIVLIKLLLAHFIGDFLLQPKSWVDEKERLKALSPKLYLHILIHCLLVLLVLWDLNYWLLALILMISHGLIDLLKLYAQKETNRSKWFLLDQAFHFIIILVLWYVWFNPVLDTQQWLDNPDVWIYITALFFITQVAGIVIQILMSKWSKALNENSDESLSSAGKYIGILERLFVFTFVVTGKWEAIGFLLAAKSVFRFGDLKESKDRKLTEYILIGTLLSFSIALAAGLIVLQMTEVD